MPVMTGPEDLFGPAAIESVKDTKPTGGEETWDRLQRMCLTKEAAFQPVPAVRLPMGLRTPKIA